MYDGDADEASANINGGDASGQQFYNWEHKIPAGSVVTDIKIEIRTRLSSSTTNVFHRFSAAATYKTVSVSSTESTKSINGTPTFWELTNAQAISAINSTSGSIGWRFYIDGPVAGVTVYVEFVRMTVTYTPPSTAMLLAK
jgi:hypothetical protein